MIISRQEAEEAEQSQREHQEVEELKRTESDLSEREGNIEEDDEIDSQAPKS